MGDFGMELDAIDGLRVVSDGGEWGILCATDDVEVLGKLLELISMGHPDLVSRTHANDKRVVSCSSRRRPPASHDLGPRKEH